MSKPKKPVTVVYFYMIGCPHCEAMRPAWEDAKKSLKNKADIKEVESRDVMMSDGVYSFPTVVLRRNGKEVKRIEGKRKTGGEIIMALKLSRGDTGRRRTYRGKRKTRNRTLRNYKALA